MNYLHIFVNSELEEEAPLLKTMNSAFTKSKTPEPRLESMKYLMDQRELYYDPEIEESKTPIPRRIFKRKAKHIGENLRSGN